MNLERGVKRIALVVSVVVGLGTWVHSSRMLYDYWYWEREQYLSYKEKHENIRLFWETWDTDGWTRDGNKMSKNDVLRALLDSPYHPITFTTGNVLDQVYSEVDSPASFALSGSDVVPGLDLVTLDFGPAAVAREVRKARDEGLSRAFANCLGTETFWTRQTRLQLRAFSIACGFTAGLGAFVTVWLLFFLLRWIGRGFATATERAPEIEKSDGLMFSHPNHASGDEDNKSLACHTQGDTQEEVERQTMTLG